MPVTKDQANMLASLAVSCRPTGAPRWDEPGIVAAIGKVAHLHLADVAHAVLRAAEDRTAKTPGVIAAVGSVHWRDRNPDRPAERKPFDPQGTCATCSQSEARCREVWADDHEFVSVNDHRRAVTLAKVLALGQATEAKP